MNNCIVKIVSSLLLVFPFFLPVMARAALSDPSNGIGLFVASVVTFINISLIPLVFAVALLVFLYGMYKYFIVGGADTNAQESGRQLMLYAIIGFVLMVSIWGIVNLIASGLGLGGEMRSYTPEVPYSNYRG